jgi:hypothetical protein
VSTYFSKVIKAGERQREFNFKLTSINDETRYSVDVPDDKGNRVLFTMYRNADGQWKTAAQLLPLWIHNAEESLAEAIEEHKKNEIKRR